MGMRVTKEELQEKLSYNNERGYFPPHHTADGGGRGEFTKAMSVRGTGKVSSRLASVYMMASF